MYGCSGSLSARIFQIENHRTDSDEIWTVCICMLPQIPTLQFPAVSNTNVTDARTCKMRTTLAPITIGSYVWKTGLWRLSHC
jgi:hypothetical protein